jgi:hypothetical protein
MALTEAEPFQSLGRTERRGALLDARGEARDETL